MLSYSCMCGQFLQMHRKNNKLNLVHCAFISKIKQCKKFATQRVLEFVAFTGDVFPESTVMARSSKEAIIGLDAVR